MQDKGPEMAYTEAKKLAIAQAVVGTAKAMVLAISEEGRRQNTEYKKVQQRPPETKQDPLW